MSNLLFYLLIVHKFGKLQSTVIVLLLSGVAVEEEKKVRIASDPMTNTKPLFDDPSLPDTLDCCLHATEVLGLVVDLVCTVEERDAARGSVAPVY